MAESASGRERRARRGGLDACARRANNYEMSAQGARERVGEEESAWSHANERAERAKRLFGKQHRPAQFSHGIMGFRVQT
ncbi:MAG: hypothetical protein A2X99_04750 [Deltaproteobacteria bacterium GWB2_55_19]|nr:MAG: hypothetical protein A2X99_04750 [Deltaproteobacteria bacterium GWB2_55_19]HAO94147.1 hypothetical protein [Deltaproteobacteria bacterium]